MLLTTPERRLSLRLKRQELWQQGRKDLWAALGEVEEGLPYIDLLDESDELLTHRRGRRGGPTCICCFFCF